MTRGLNILTAFPFQEQSVAQPLSPLQGAPELVELSLVLASEGFITGTELSRQTQPPGVTKLMAWPCSTRGAVPLMGC